MKQAICTVLTIIGLALALFFTSDYTGTNDNYHIDIVDTVEEIEHQTPATVTETTISEPEDGFMVRLGREGQVAGTDLLLPMDAGLLDRPLQGGFIQPVTEQTEEAHAAFSV
ncbi:hypothetical protein AAV35_001880 [Salimicrobium jeotgali]|uniref:Uncharacterized protein n=3 Tax=Salimicrobium TaxID=351195 RepID=K2GA27_9BACI|nr:MULTISPECIES: hypothetical protein [Salimicrobium]AKG03657.1 hypothetical protein AAV35_001880 [Salimicrobium jeotgali]EKE31943.1 hypothetical protein MJ3_06043 [Salimicrobium jeotgali]MBM7696127.1 hypothetical protein [Salimicrobium jeotgali]PBB04887.1 hypothetical protein CKW00_11810 [Salimicrobium humidisoli]SIS80979.1 hypothetical protein SAMN05421758_10684 [Salimicrobium salexigens]